MNSAVKRTTLPLNIPCGHHSWVQRRAGFRYICTKCGSFWDLESLAIPFEYTNMYPLERGHFNKAVGLLKIKTLENWLNLLNIDLTDLVVCEVGFGGGHCLSYLERKARAAFGIEVIASALRNAADSGIRQDRLLSYNDIGGAKIDRIDFWVFQDSFEHLEHPREFVHWLSLHSNRESRVLMVLPRADSLSRRFMGRFWIHKTKDHQYHWSKSALITLFSSFGFRLSTTFYPLKFISFPTVITHLGHMLKSASLKKIGMTFPVEGIIPLNFGEMGLLFTKDDAHENECSKKD
jgi:hypothetical protein